MLKTKLLYLFLILTLIVCNSINAQKIDEISILTKKATQNDAKAQLELGAIYQLGGSVEKDEKKSFYWTKRSAENGNLEAKTNLGLLYESGIGVEKDHAKSIYWITDAAKKNYPVAQYLLGTYYKGNLNLENMEASLEWIKKSAANNYEPAKKYLLQYNKEVEEQSKKRIENKNKTADCDLRSKEINAEEIRIKELIKKVSSAESLYKKNNSKLTDLVNYLNDLPYKSCKTYDDAYEDYTVLKNTTEESVTEYENLYFTYSKAIDNYDYKLELYKKECAKY